MRSERELVLRVTTHLPLLRDLLSGQAHAVSDAHVIFALEDRRRQGRRVAHHRHHTHAFYASGDHHVGLANANAVRRHLHGRQARCAKAIHGDAADAVRQPGQHRADARDVQALLRLRNGAAADDVFDSLRVESRHLRESGAQGGREQIVRTVVAEKAAVRFADGRARGGDDVGVLELFHGVDSFVWVPSPASGRGFGFVPSPACGRGLG